MRRTIVLRCAGLFLLLLATICTIAGCSTTIPENLAELPGKASLPQAGYDTVQVRYFGVSTLLFTSGDTSIMIDGFFSRPSLPRLVFGPLRPDVSRIKAALRAGDVKYHDETVPQPLATSDGARPAITGGEISLKRIFVSHSHFDHAMDVGVVARLTGARITGSESTRQIALEQGAAGKTDVVGDSAVVRDATPFTVQIFKVNHGPTPLPFRFPGAIAGPLGPLANMGSYREGINYAYWICHRAVSMLVVPSADDSIELPAAAKGAVDVVFLGIGRLGKQDQASIVKYWKRAVEDSGAGLVIPIHWDDFTRPLELGLQPLPRIADNMAVSIDELQRLAKDARPPVDVKRLPLFRPVWLQSSQTLRNCGALMGVSESSAAPRAPRQTMTDAEARCSACAPASSSRRNVRQARGLPLG